MEELTAQAGRFWLPEDDTYRLPGTLTFTATEGGEVTLFADAESGDHLLDHGSGKRRLVGLIGDEYVTLEGCFPRFTEIFGAEQRLSVDTVVRGAAFDDGGQLDFDSISFEVDNGIEWLEKSAVSSDFTEEEGRKVIAMALRPIPTESAATQFGSIEVLYGWSTHGPDLRESTFSQTRRFQLHFDERQSLAEALRYCRAVQDLVTLAVDAPCLIHSVKLYRSDVTTEFAEGKSHRVPLDLFMQNRSRHKPLTKPRQPHEMLFTFDQIGGIEGLGRWMTVAAKNRTTLDSMLSLKYGGGLYLENRLQNVVHAAETMHRISFPNNVLPPTEFKAFKRALVKQLPPEHRTWLHTQLQYSNEPRLAARLRELADYAGPTATDLVGDSAAWGKTIADLRNGLVHHPEGDSQTPSTDGMHYLTESVYWALLLCLVRECGWGEPVTAAISRHRQFTWVQQRLAERPAP